MAAPYPLQYGYSLDVEQRGGLGCSQLWHIDLLDNCQDTGILDYAFAVVVALAFAVPAK